MILISVDSSKSKLCFLSHLRASAVFLSLSFAVMLSFEILYIFFYRVYSETWSGELSCIFTFICVFPNRLSVLILGFTTFTELMNVLSSRTFNFNEFSKLPDLK